jgi:hypothetical protein
VYWYNGQEYLVSDNGYISSAYIDDENMYFAGYAETGEEYLQKLYNGNEVAKRRMVAKYWMGGKEITLSDGKYDATASDIFVYGNEVYIVGSESISNDYSLQNGQSTRGKIWKNGVLLKDYPLDAISAVLKIKVIDNKIYLLEYIDGECYVNFNDSRIKLDINSRTYNVLSPSDLLIHNADYYVISHMWGWFEMNNVMLWANGEENKITPKVMSYSLDSLFIDSNTPYVLYSKLTPRLRMSLNVISFQNESIVEYYAGTSTIDANISGLNMNVEDIYILGSSVYIIGFDEKKGRYWLNGTEHELSFKPFKIFVNGNNVWILGIEDKEIVVYKNDEKTVLVKDVNLANIDSKIYQDKSDLIIILKYYDSKTRKQIFKIFKNRKEIDIYDFQSSGLYPLKVLYKNGILYSCGTTGGGHYYYSIGNKSYNLREKRQEVTINDFDVKEDLLDLSQSGVVPIITSRTVYMVGTYNGFPALWKNKERQLLSDEKAVAKLIVVK